MVSGRKICKLVFFLVAILFLAQPVFASTTDGTISAGDAWSERIGWLNFMATNGNVHVTDSQLTGYVWSALYGWIKLNPTNSGVTNNAEGDLSGSAWGENIGWIDFDGVTIGSTGIFSGTATGDNTGVVNFSCSTCLVQTDWRPASTRTPTTTPPGSGGGGGSGNTLPPPQITPPTSTYYILLNNGASQTNTTTINVLIHASTDTAYVWLSEDPLFLNNSIRVDFSPTSTEKNTPFILSLGAGQKIVYAKFCNQWGTCGDLISGSILYAPVTNFPPPVVTPPPVPHPTSTIIGGIIGNIKDIIGHALSKIFPVNLTPNRFARLFSEIQLWIPSWFKPPAIQKVPVETFVARQTPRVFKGAWDYLDPIPPRRFVFAPLPKEFLALTNKFPEMKNILKQVGINRLSDINKLRSVQMYLPGLTQSVAFRHPEITTTEFGSEKAIPVGELTQNVKDKIPANVVFARAAGHLVDFRIALSLTDKNRPEQKITTISGKSLQLTVRPDFPAKRVRGYLVFRSKTPQARVEMPLAGVINSLLFAEPAFAYSQEQPIEVEEKLVLLSFDYTDPDGDGIYTADIVSPIPSGEYEIITVIDYVDPELGSKQIRLITVVDPEGYVFEKVGNKELRIPGASVTLYHFNTISKSYEVWPAADFQQTNPQTTDIRGSYSFLVTGGKYYLEVKAPNYGSYKGDEFIVDEGDGVHFNIELRSKYWWLNVVDWKTALLILVAMLLLWNFHKDKMRERKEKQENKPEIKNL